MSLTPEEARALLENFNATDQEEFRNAYLQTELLSAVMKGPHATELAELHEQATKLRVLGQDASEPEEKRAALIEQIIADNEAKLDRFLEEGNPAPWQNWPK